MIRTSVGYTGGTLENPDYHHLGDHSEAIRIEYDPSRISYEKLLEVFWEGPHPELRILNPQYLSAVFFHSKEQRRLALKTREEEAGKRKTKIYTKTLPATEFYPAEHYHQKYRLRRHSDFLGEFEKIYPAAGDLIASTAAARVNGYLGGYGNFKTLSREVGEFGLSPKGTKKLLALVSRREKESFDTQTCAFPP